MISIRDVHKSFGSLHAVSGVSLEVRPGEAFGLLGPNGAGKTTLLSMAVGILRPDSGAIAIGGQGDPTRPEVRRLIGVAPQALSIYPELTGAENLTFFARLYGLTGSALAQRVDFALDFVGLTDRRSDLASTYSGGMQRRLNLAAAILHDPQILLLDEPTVGVDPQSRNHLFESVERFKALGRTIIYTTHYMEEAQRLCDRVAIMDKGQVLALDSVDTLIARHGGNAVVTAEFLTPLDQPPPIPGALLTGSSLRFESAKPIEEVAALSSRGLQFHSVRIDQPDLETVFLTLTGRRLRDE